MFLGHVTCYQCSIWTEFISPNCESSNPSIKYSPHLQLLHNLQINSNSNSNSSTSTFLDRHTLFVQLALLHRKEMAPCVRDLFIPTATRAYLTGLLRGRKSTIPHKSTNMAEQVHSFSNACPADEVVATCNSSISTADITTATTSKSLTKTPDVSRTRPDFKDQPPTIIRIVVTDQAADDTNEQKPGHPTAVSQDSAIPNQMQQPTKDFSHAPEYDTK
jgi:hypothetical protein